MLAEKRVAKCIIPSAHSSAPRFPPTIPKQNLARNRKMPQDVLETFRAMSSCLNMILEHFLNTFRDYVKDNYLVHCCHLQASVREDVHTILSDQQACLTQI